MMGENSNIEWCHCTWNPWIGCTKVSPGCANCYAASEDNRRKWTPEGWGKGKPRHRTSERNWSEPVFWDRKAKKSGKRKRVFCSSLADWLDNEVPVQWFVGLLKTVRKCRNLDWLLLTKRPENFLDRMEAVLREPDGDLPVGLREWIEKWLAGKAPKNVWMGVSVEDQQRANERIPELLHIPAQVRFLSVEPMLGPINLACIESPKGPRMHALDGHEAVYTFGGKLILSKVHWVIAGGESGVNARPCDPQWVRQIRDQCLLHEVPFFFKQWGEYGITERWELGASVCGQQMIGEVMERIGKKAAGRLLDGIEWSQFPEVAGK